MDAELDNLAGKITVLAEHCSALKSENHALRQRVLKLEQQNRQLSAKVDGARDRVAALLARIPSEDEA